jgi:hypothetical protein
MTTDFSQVSDEQMEHIFGLLENSPDFIPNVAERQAFVAEYFRRRKPKPAPTNVDANLEAAATPVTPDPSLKPKAAPAPDPQSAHAARMVAAGYTPDEARIGAEYESRQVGAFNPAFSNDETLRAGAAYMRDQDRREGAFERELDLAYGTTPDPSGPPDLTQFNPPAPPIRPGMSRGVVGPRTDDGRDPMPAPNFQTQDEADAYYTRPVDPKTGVMTPSPADQAMMARGFVPVYTPDGGISYSLAADYDGPGGIADQMSPAARRQASAYEGPNGVRIGADNRPIYDPLKGTPQRTAWENVQVNTPFGPRAVLRLTDEARQAQADRRNRAAADRVAARTGINAKELLDPTARGLASSRDYENDRQARRSFLANRNMLAGGSHNINSGNAAMFNQLAMMSPEEQIRQLQYALPGGELRAQVDARQLDTAARLAQQAVTGALAGTAAGPLSDAQAESLQIANAAKRAEQRRAVEDDLAERYAKEGWFGYDEFTLAEQQQMIDTLVNVHKYTLAEAQDAVDRIATERRATERRPRPGSAAPVGGGG